jgi:hypothetical protein
VTSNLEVLRDEIKASNALLAEHGVFSSLRSIDDLRLFMEWHVFAVWDFLSLLKRLQRDLTGSALPWTPPTHPRAARLVNEIVLGEESDLLPNGLPLSHFELYLGAMREIGADTSQIEGFVEQLRQGISLEAALARAGLAAPVAAFVRATLQTALHGDLDQVLGSFFYGRENVIPRMFAGLLDNWRVDPDSAPMFVHYLRRHIALDGEAHGPMARAIIEDLIDGDERRESQLLSAAAAALKQREAFWSALQQRLADEPRRQVAE